MQRLWSADELGEQWSLRPEDLALLAGMVDPGKLAHLVPSLAQAGPAYHPVQNSGPPL